MAPKQKLPIRRSNSEAAIQKRPRLIGRPHQNSGAQSHLSSIGPFANAVSVSQMFGAVKSVGDTPSIEGEAIVPPRYGRAVMADEGPSPFSCNTCAKVFDSKTLLKNHVMQFHEGKTVVKCPHCERAFTRPSQLRKHIVSSHDHRTEEYYCDKCKFKNRELHLFYEHIHVHNKCRYCGNEFPQLSRHESKCPFRE